MDEKDFYGKICKHYTKHTGVPMAIEVKITKGKSLPFRSLMKHQEDFLLQSRRAFAYKIPDIGISRKPFDILLLHHARAVIVVIFYRARDSGIYEIPIREFINERELGNRESLTEQRASEIGKKIDL